MASSHALLAALHRAAIEGVSPFPCTRDAVSRWLSARNEPAPVHIFALGKAAPEMARGAIEALAAPGCAGGVVIAAHTPEYALPLPLRVGDHPLPGLGSLAAADAIAMAVSAVDSGDDVLVLLSGGTTSLCAAPCAELVAIVGHPADAQDAICDAVSYMLGHGMAIHEMNAIRRRLLRWGAGRLATALYARAARRVHVLAISDVIGDDPAVIGSAPCTADPLQPEDVLALCDAHALRDAFDSVIERALGISGSTHLMITPPAAGHPAFSRVTYEVIAGNPHARDAAGSAARARGISNVVVMDEPLEGDAEELGAAIVHAGLRFAAHVETPALLIWGGEPTMHLADREGALRDDEDPPFELVEEPLGGRMQALALSAALVLDNAAYAQPKRRPITLLAAGTDGRDGPTDAAGAIVDAATAQLARRNGRDPARDLQLLRSYVALDAASALIRTGPTGTNTMDLVMLLIE